MSETREHHLTVPTDRFENRRAFLKKAGLGAAGLGALWIAPNVTTVKAKAAYAAATSVHNTATVTAANIDVDNGGFNVIDSDTSNATEDGPRFAGSTHFVYLTGQAGTPIAGDLQSVIDCTSILDEAGQELNAGRNPFGQLQPVQFFAGDDTNDPWITLQVNVTGIYRINSITYQT